MVNRHARQSCLSGLARWSGHPGAKSVEKPHAVAVGDRCRVDAIAEVVEEVLDPAGDGDDEFARRAAEDVVAVRDPSGQENEVARRSEPFLLTAVNAVLPVEV